MLSLRLKFHQQAMQGCVHLLCLQSAKGEVSGCFINYKITIAHRVIERKPQQGDKAQGVHQYVIRAFTSVSVPSRKKSCAVRKKEEYNKGKCFRSPHPAAWQTLQECDPACLSVELGCVRESGSDCRMAVGRIVEKKPQQQIVRVRDAILHLSP